MVLMISVLEKVVEASGLNQDSPVIRRTSRPGLSG
jgi:hypothetical protein